MFFQRVRKPPKEPSGSSFNGRPQNGEKKPCRIDIVSAAIIFWILAGFVAGIAFCAIIIRILRR